MDEEMEMEQIHANHQHVKKNNRLFTILTGPDFRSLNGYGRSTGANFPLRGLCLAQISVKYEWIITMKIYAKTKTKKHQGVISKKYKNMQPSQLLCSQHQGGVCVCVCVCVCVRVCVPHLIPKVHEFRVIRIRLQNVCFSSCVNTNYNK